MPGSTLGSSPRAKGPPGMTSWVGAVRRTPRRADPTAASHIATPPNTSCPALCRPPTSSSATACSRGCPGRGPGMTWWGGAVRTTPRRADPTVASHIATPPKHVMAGLVQAIHVLFCQVVFAWMPGTGPGHDAVGWGYQEDAATGRPGRGPRTIATPHKHVMAGLVPAMHVFLGNGVFAWMPGTGPGHDVVGWGCQED